MHHPIGIMLRRIEKAVQPFPKAAMFGLMDEGYTTLFEQLVACIISIRGMDESTYPLARKLFAKARTAREMLKLGEAAIAAQLHGTSFPEQKAATIVRIAQAAKASPGAELPTQFEALTAIKGVGPKCASLALGVAAGQQRISVDVHVHRVVNRWGLVATRTPEKTLEALEAMLPRKYWSEINRLLMPFGKHICTRRLPHCSTCPVLRWCERVGVAKSQ
jgi:endonuclease-3